MASVLIRPAKVVLISSLRSVTVKAVRKLHSNFEFPRCKKEMEGLEITDMKVVPCVNSRFIQPSRVVFKQVRRFQMLKVEKKVSVNLALNRLSSKVFWLSFTHILYSKPAISTYFKHDFPKKIKGLGTWNFSTGSRKKTDSFPNFLSKCAQQKWQSLQASIDSRINDSVIVLCNIIMNGTEFIKTIIIILMRWDV